MKLLFNLTVYVLFIVQIVYGQDIIPNGGFEEHRGKGHSMYWTQADGEFNHFYHKRLNPQTGGAANGDGYHCLCMYGMQPNEFMHIALSIKLEKGRVYTVSMKTRLSNSGDEVYKDGRMGNLKQIDWYFTNLPINVTQKLFITAEPSISFSFNGATNKTWQQKSLQYIANGTEEFLTIGNITRLYAKIRQDEILDSLEFIYDNLKNKEKAEADSVRERYAPELRKTINYEESDFSMNPYIKNKKKRYKRKIKKQLERDKKHNAAIGTRIGMEQQTVYRKYANQKLAIETEVDLQKNLYAVNVCFDDIKIEPTNEMQDEQSNEFLSTEKGKTIVLKNILFETASFELKSESDSQLTELVNWMKKNEEIAIQLSGHTDNVGEEKSNQILSENRAKEVMKYLIKNGIQPNRIKCKGYGSLYSLTDNSTERGRALNRRVELTIM